MGNLYTKVAAESGLAWRKSSHSNAESNCVEIAAFTGRATAVRDSKDPAGPALVFPADGWQAFVSSVRAGDFPADY